MRGNTGIPGSSYKWFPAFDLDMFPGFNVFVPFCQTKIYHVNSFDLVPLANHEIVCFDVTMDETFTVNLLQPGYYLQANIDGCGQGKFFIANY